MWDTLLLERAADWRMEMSDFTKKRSESLKKYENENYTCTTSKYCGKVKTHHSSC
jgi:hypothetical protein